MVNPRRVVVVPHDPSWAAQFGLERARIAQALDGALVELHHIGSTSIAGMPAKPVIDMLLEVDSLTWLDEHTPELVALGYEAVGEYGIPERRYFRLSDERGVRTHHLHAFVRGSTHVRRHLAFRDYMRAHPEAARAYAALKQELAARYPDDRGAYVHGKDDFVRTHEALALAWATERGR